MSRKREWFVAVADVSGENEGNPAAFIAAKVFGPYTRKQAFAAQDFGDQFPHATLDVVAFNVDGGRPEFSDLMARLGRLLAEAKEDAARDATGSDE